LSQKARAKIAKTRREYKEAVEEAVSEIAPRPAAATQEPARAKLQEGARVRLKGIRQAATVRRVLTNGLIEVDAGFMKMQVPAADVEEILGDATGSGTSIKGATMKATPALKNVSFQQRATFEVPYREINLIGQRAEQACEQVDKFLDSAALAQVEQVRIIHGHGMGILKRAIADLLLQNPHVEKFYAAAPEQGGGGATIVELKD
jgi:DNA mismatch repair protein MutS2